MIHKVTTDNDFDLKLNFKRQSRLVAGGQMTYILTELTYSSVVSRESIRGLKVVAPGGMHIRPTAYQKWVSTLP